MNNTNQSLVSIIIPTYNSEKYIDKNISSLLNQSIGFNNLEIIYCDDCSDDRTVDIIEEYKIKFKNIKLIRNNSNTGGPSVGRNAGIKESTGKYIMFMDSDDEYYQDSIEVMYDSIKKNNDELLLGKICLQYENGDTNINPMYFILGETRCNLRINEEKEFLQLIASIPSMIISRRLLIDNKIYFPEDISIAEDKVFQVNILSKCNTFGFINRNIYKYKIRGDSSSLSQKSRKDIFYHVEEVKKARDKILNILPYDKELSNIAINDLLATTLYRLDYSFNTLPSTLKNFLIDSIKDIMCNVDFSMYKEMVVDKLQKNVYSEIYTKAVLIESDNLIGLEEYLNNIYENNKLKKELKIYKQSLNSKINRIDSNKVLGIKIKEMIIKLGVAAIYYITKPVFSYKKISLVAERSDQAEDNGYHFFKYCRLNHPKDNIYYIINKNCKQCKNIEGFGHVIYRNSIKHYLYLLHAQNYISAYDFATYAYPKKKNIFIKYFEKYVRANRIFLQHGVSLTKANYYHKYNNRYDNIVVSTQKEVNIFKELYGYNDESIIKSGLARFDNLVDMSNDKEKKILFMPTWRQELENVKDEEFQQSEYYISIMELLSDKKMLNLLESNNIKLIFYPHYVMQKYIHLFDKLSNNIIIASKKKYNVQQLLKECNLLITDFSSVGCDFSYLNKPVIFYQFSKKNFHYEINIEKEYVLYSDFGKVVDCKDKVIEYLESYINTNCRNFLCENKKVFMHNDLKNSERIYDYIKNLKKKKSKNYSDSIRTISDIRKIESSYYKNSYRLKERKTLIENKITKKELFHYGERVSNIYYDSNQRRTHKELYIRGIHYKTVSYKNKKTDIEIIVNNGMKSEVIHYFDDNKQFKKVHQYFNDNIMTKRITYYKNGKISSILINDGIGNPELLECYDNKGDLIKKVKYYEAGKPKEAVHYKCDKIVKKDIFDFNSNIVEVEYIRNKRIYKRDILLSSKEVFKTINY